MQITKEFKFEMAHKLSKSYTEKCQHIHGHSYRVIVTLDSPNLNDEGVVVDFTQVKEVLSPLFDKLDHSFLCHCLDESLDLIMQLKERDKRRIFICSKNPTAEHLAAFILAKLKASTISVFAWKVEVFETATSSAACSYLEPEQVLDYLAFLGEEV